MKKVKLQISENLLSILLKMKDSRLANLLITEISSDLLVEDYADYLDFSNQDSTKLSYVNPKRLAKILESKLDVWTAFNFRYQSKPGALLGKIFNNQVLNQKEVENFVNTFKSLLVENDYTFSVVEGGKIKKWYDGENYAQCSGSLGNSCMKYEGCQEYFNFYIENGVEMLVLKDIENKLVGRALLWVASDIESGQKVNVLDRIYTINDDELVPLFKNWAERNGYIYRQNQNWNSSLHWIERGQLVEKKLLVVLDKIKFSHYPYLDSFRFLNRNTGALTNFLPKDFEKNPKNKTLISTEGNYLNNKTLVLDEITHFFLHRNDCIYLENEDFYTNYENVNRSNILDRYLLRTDSLWVEEINDYIFLDWDRNPEMVRQKVTLARKNFQEKQEKIKSLNIKDISDIFTRFRQMQQYLDFDLELEPEINPQPE